jgi:DNA integrity scanning protein DisA with diadenylate cyclase activity
MAKRSQLAVGQEWAYNNKRQHEYTTWGNSHYKATIVALEPYERSYGGKIWQTTKGNGVLVEIENYLGVGRRVLQLSQLWKPWAEYEAGLVEYKAQHEIALAKAKVAKAERQKFLEEVHRPALKEFQKAVEQISGKYVGTYTTVEELPIEVLQAVAGLIKEKVGV